MITRYCIIRNNTIALDGRVLYKGEGRKAGDFLEDAYSFFKTNYPKFYKMDNLCRAGFLGAELLLKDHVLTEKYPPENIALILSNKHSSLDTDIRFATSARTMASPALFVYTLPNIVAGEICIRHKIKGENAFFVSPAFDATLITGYTSVVIANRQTDACIAGWVDVLGEHYDVFLYLLEKNSNTSLKHTAEQVGELYNNTLWNN